MSGTGTEPLLVDGFIDDIETRIGFVETVSRLGRVGEVIGSLIRVTGLALPLGEVCELLQPDGQFLQRAEVVGFTRRDALLSPFGAVHGVSSATLVRRTHSRLAVPMGPELLGRVLNAVGEPIDGKGPLADMPKRPVMVDPPDPMSRAMIEQAMPTGVRAIDALITFGEGQRIGVFAAAGVGKSTLMGMLARGTRCDISIIVLIGERGREVREFIEIILGPEGMKRSVVVCATSDRSSIERAKAAHTGTAIAEYFRDQGLKVLLMMDSLTRFARALREIGLAAGEPPARRGFPPSVFSELPRLLERTGMGEKGSITALYTILAEDENSADPIAEEVRGILDGHIILSRKIAARNMYPAIDVLGSLSRVMTLVTSAEHQAAAGRLRRMMAKYDELEVLMQAGEYKSGQDAEADEAIQKNPAVRAFLGQAVTRLQPFTETLAQLTQLTGTSS
jgi:type III secretion protein N (ATPase)